MSGTAPNSRTRWLPIALGVIVVAALAFGIGRFTAFGASAAPATPSTVSADAGFARDMQVHHAQAIDMAMTIYRTTGDDQLRALAYDIATGQAAQKGEMFGWLVEWNLPQAGEPLMSWMSKASMNGHNMSATPASDADALTQMGMATDGELARLKSDTGQAADCLFLSLMIRHHQGAIPMAEAAVELATDARVRAVAASMKATQSTEIDAMTSMQMRLGCTG